jgi:hypothetical protein
MQSLFAALHAQSSGTASQQGTSDSGNASTSAVSGVGRPNPGSDLQSLIAELNSSGSGGTSAASSTTGSSAASNTTLDNLEQSFSNLVASLGGTDGSQATLTGFLNTLATDMANMSPLGNLVSTQA